MVGKTSLNYNRQTLNQFGRAAGPIFSVFTKWPAAIAGEIVTEWSTRGSKGRAAYTLVKKFAGPLAAMSAIDVMMSGSEDTQQVADAIFSKAGLRAKAPISSPASLLTGEMFTPPALEALKKAGSTGYRMGQSLKEGEFGEAFTEGIKTGWKALSPWNPVMNVYGHLEDIDALFGTELAPAVTPEIFESKR